MKIRSMALSLSFLLIMVVSVVAIPSPSAATDFSMTPSFINLNILPGQVGAATINITSMNGFTGDVALQPSTPPSGCIPLCTTWSLSPSNVTLGPAVLSGTATLIIIAGTTGGSANITVTGTSGTMWHMSTVEYIIPVAMDFMMTASPSNVTFAAGSSSTSTVTVTGSGGFNGTVIFNLASSPGLVAEIAPQNLTGSGSATVFLSAPAPGNYTMTVRGTSGLLVHSTAILVTATDPSTGIPLPQPTPVPDFTITVSPPVRTIRKGSTTTFTIMITGINGFNGTVSLSATITPVSNREPTASFLMNSNTNSTLTVNTTRHTPRWTFTITIQATSGTITHTVTVLLTVTN